MASNLHGRHLGACFSHLADKVLVKGEHIGSLHHVGEEFIDHLVVHGNAVSHIQSLIGVLGTCTHGHHKPSVLGFGHHDVEEELGSALHDGIDTGEIAGIAGIEIVPPQVLAEPCATRGPHAPRSVHRSGGAPNVGIVVQAPTAGAIHRTGGLATGLRHLACHADEGLVQFAQMGHLGGPIVHLGIDIGGVLAAPRRRYVFVPNALQIGSLTPGLRAGDEQIASELEVEFHKLRVVTGGKLFHALVCGKIHGGRGTQVETHTVEVVLILLSMCLQKLGIFLALGGSEGGKGTLVGIATDVLIVDKIGANGDEERNGRGSAHTQSVVACHHLSTVRLGTEHSGEL